MSHRFFYPAIFEPEDIGYSVYVPDIAGCMTQGDTMEEALNMVQEAIGLMLEDKHPNQYPKPSNPKDVEVTGNQFVMMVEFNKLAYDRKYNAKAVKKTLSIPAWLKVLSIFFRKIMNRILVAISQGWSRHHIHIDASCPYIFLRPIGNSRHDVIWRRRASTHSLHQGRCQ